MKRKWVLWPNCVPDLLEIFRNEKWAKNETRLYVLRFELCIDRSSTQPHRTPSSSYPALSDLPCLFIIIMSSRPPYKGSRRRLVMAFDVGTTFSGISYRYIGQFPTLFRSFIRCSCSILDPGQVPEVKGVTRYFIQFTIRMNLKALRFPAQEHSSGSSKIPTIVYYDKQGTIRAIGAEAASEGIFEQAEDGDWYKVEWYGNWSVVLFGCWLTLP